MTWWTVALSYSQLCLSFHQNCLLCTVCIGCHGAQRRCTYHCPCTVRYSYAYSWCNLKFLYIHKSKWHNITEYCYYCCRCTCYWQKTLLSITFVKDSSIPRAQHLFNKHKCLLHHQKKPFWNFR